MVETKEITMLDHQKIVLNGVCDSEKLFKKELIKSMLWLSVHERVQFNTWVRENFLRRHPEIINEVLYPEANMAQQFHNMLCKPECQ